MKQLALKLAKKAKLINCQAKNNNILYTLVTYIHTLNPCFCKKGHSSVWCHRLSLIWLPHFWHIGRRQSGHVFFPSTGNRHSTQTICCCLEGPTTRGCFQQKVITFGEFQTLLHMLINLQHTVRTVKRFSAKRQNQRYFQLYKGRLWLEIPLIWSFLPRNCRKPAVAGSWVLGCSIIDNAQ